MPPPNPACIPKDASLAEVVVYLALPPPPCSIINGESLLMLAGLTLFKLSKLHVSNSFNRPMGFKPGYLAAIPFKCSVTPLMPP